ncbi:MAG: efflux RND transporter periplasmic adaptor subunit [Phycisphaera sp.]|nr:efflux RND transporter periplasmic adaptor subunit [Phycisphaera sp.]
MPQICRSSRTRRLAGLLATALLTGCGGSENAYQAPPPPAVTAIKPPLHDFEPYQDNVATVRPLETIEVRARVSGFLNSREFTPGQQVETGQVLFTLEPDEYQAAVNGANADLSAANARLQLDTEVRQKYQIAFDKGAASEVELLESKAKVEVSAASVEQAQAKLERAQLDLSYTTVTSPIDGRIGEELVSSGNLVGRAEPTLLAKISTIDPMKVYFDVSEKAYLKFRQGMEAAGEDPDERSTYPFELVLPDGTIYDQIGHIDFLDIEIDRTTGTMQLRGTIANPIGLLRNGLFVRARVREPMREALALPASAILVDMAGEYVYLLGENDVVSRQGVKTGETIDGLTEILKGLDSESVVIVDGILRARPGAPVTPEIVDLPEAMRRIDPGSTVAETD